MTTVVAITEETFFREVIDSEVPVLVDFYADRCGPCEVIAPMLEEFCVEYEGKVKFTKFLVVIDEVLTKSNELVNRYDVIGFPTLLLFQQGEVVSSHLGSLTRSELIEFLGTVLK
ncbi:co-chaperone YbbN [Sporosarcina sp. Te-1]|uniref:thioredoxin family protein n=1 Tax=Sporosarcina sp. Te-1 TaxID=2818390 RepID=UPI001A9D04CB|nr:thioredoxin domain-containing protein [Sporosarcina sp. Te-1]QTD40837.1 thioredoxin [Sporosarcina sp. Te-1]